MTKALVGTIAEIKPLTQSNGDKPVDIKNIMIETKTVNDFGLEVVEHLKIVLFSAVARTAEKLGFKEGDHIFLDKCRVEKRPYERNGCTIMSEDTIAETVAKISAKQYAEIAKKLTKATEDKPVL